MNENESGVPNNSMKPTTYRAAVQRLFHSRGNGLVAGGLSRPLGGTGLQRFYFWGDSTARLA